MFCRDVRLSVCTQAFWSFWPPALLLCRPTHFLEAPAQSSVVSEHVSYIHPGPFHGSPLHINIVCWMGISGRSCVETLEYLLFKGLVPYAVLVRGEQRCVFGWGRCRADTVSLSGRASKSYSRLPPIICSSLGKAQVRSHRTRALCVCTCVCTGVSVCHCLPIVLWCQCFGLWCTLVFVSTLHEAVLWRGLVRQCMCFCVSRWIFAKLLILT